MRSVASTVLRRGEGSRGQRIPAGNGRCAILWPGTYGDVPGSAALDPTPDTRKLLSALENEDPRGVDEVFQLVYAELRAIARRQRQRTPAADTLNTTAVVHEAYIKLLGHSLTDLKDRAHFFNLAARVMRQVLLDNARQHLAQKRGGGAELATLSGLLPGAEAAADAFLELDDAITRLTDLDERLGNVVYLRFYAGLSGDETAELLGITERTVKRDWRKARAFLHREMYGDKND